MTCYDKETKIKLFNQRKFDSSLIYHTSVKLYICSANKGDEIIYTERYKFKFFGFIGCVNVTDAITKNFAIDTNYLYILSNYQIVVFAL